MEEVGVKIIDNSINNKEYIIVAGGAGYVGRYFVNYMLDNYPNIRVVIVSRNLSKKLLFQSERIEFVTSFKQLKVVNCKIFNFVYTNSSSFYYGPLMAKRYIDELIDSLDFNFEGEVFHISSIAVYDAIKRANYKYPDKLSGIRKKDPYSFTKAISENYLIDRAKSKKARIRILRIGNVIGPGSIWIKILIKRLQLGLPITADSPHPSNATYVKNLACILDRISCDLDDRIFYNICEFGDVSWEEWVNPISELIDEKPIKWHVDSVSNLDYGIKEDIKFLKGKMYTSIVPNVMKLTAMNNSILKLLSKRNIDKSRVRAKKQVRYTVARPYLNVQEFKMAKIYLESRTIKTEGVDSLIIEQLPTNLEDVLKVIKGYIEYNIN